MHVAQRRQRGALERLTHGPERAQRRELLVCRAVVAEVADLDDDERPAAQGLGNVGIDGTFRSSFSNSPAMRG